MVKFITKILMLLAVICGPVLMAQSIDVTGTVSDDTGYALPGVSVSIIGTTRGVETNFDGFFTIQAAIGDEIQISYLGMEPQKITIKNSTPLIITLASNVEQLESIVIVGYGTQKRKDVTGAIGSVKSESFNQGVVANAGQLLQGKIAGVNVTASSGEPGAGQDIVIRGIGSLRSGTSPLYVVDGFPLNNTGNPLTFINPQDIASIDVLKDASAAAIYGSRAANGVIVITTKKGKSGKTKMNVTISSAFSKLSNKVDVFSASEFRNQVVAAGGILADGGGSTDWQDALTKTGVSNNINLSMSGGTDKSSYAASFGVDDQEGIFRNSHLKRYTGRLNLTQKAINDKLKVEFSLTGSKYENTRPNSNEIVNSMISANPTDPIYTNGELTGNLSNDILNPLISENLFGDFTDSYRLLANVGTSYKIMKGLSYKLNLGIDFSSTNRDFQLKPYSTETNETLGSLSNFTTLNNNSLIENTLTYNFNKDLHNFIFLVGHSFQQTEVSQKRFNLEGFPDNGVEPRYQIGTAAGPEQSQDVFATKNELQSFFGRVNYGFASKYLVTATLRADGSSKFGANNKYGYFPSFAVGWNMSDEDFLSSSEVLNSLKLRASWGQTGSEAIPSKITKASFTESNTENDTYPLNSNANDLSSYPYGSIYTRLANPDIQWEVSTQTNIGFDFAFFDYKLTGTLDYFNKVSENILLEVTPADPIQPTDKYWTNIPYMEIRNNGFELSLDYQSDQSRDFSYNIGGNISLTENEVVNSPFKILTTGAARGSGQTGATINGVLNGESIGSFYMLEFAGISSDGLNAFNDSNDDGEILDNDRIVAGSAIPDYIYAFYFNFDYKRFDLGLNFNGVGGNKIYNHVAMSSFNKGQLVNSFNTTNRAVEFLDESATNSNTVSTRYLEDGDFLRLNNATLGYSLDANLLKLGNVLDDIRLTLTGQNLFIITDYSGFDPEINTGAAIDDIQSFGIDYFSYPKSTTVLFGLNISF
ncbi:MAG: TonB-linked SusC/RagA family outer membrane protein [Psychroserpens sp.]|jgi:TonB-linked SusC/RagA family outer membrane protein